ncbi:MAG: TMEM175 family protein, partial [Chloroflexota bacterium]
MSDADAGHRLAEDRPGRLEALSDGVFAIAVTLLIIDVVAVAKGVGEGADLAAHLVDHWATLVAYLVGFATILVCWINHHAVFRFIRRS